MKKHQNEDIGLEATLPAEITRLLYNQKNIIDSQILLTEFEANQDLFLDEYELAMIL